MLNLYFTIGFFLLIALFFIYRKMKIAAIICAVLTVLCSISTYQMYKNAVELSKQPISERRSKIITAAMLTATQTSSGKEFIKLVEFALSDKVITNEEYNTLRPFIPNEIIIQINSQYPDANAEERYYSRTSLL